MTFLFELVLIVAGLLQSLVTVYRGTLLWVKETSDDIEWYAANNDVTVDAIRRSSWLGFAVQLVFTVLYWLSLYALVFR